MKAMPGTLVYENKRGPYALREDGRIYTRYTGPTFTKDGKKYVPFPSDIENTKTSEVTSP